MGSWISYFAGVLCGITIAFIWQRSSEKANDRGTRRYNNGYMDGYNKGRADAAPKWIPFESRPLTEEEKEEYPEWDCILDCKLPDDGQQILVNIKNKSHEAVQMDEFYTDDGCYLDSGYEIGTEATAWMPLPEAWKGKQ